MEIIKINPEPIMKATNIELPTLEGIALGDVPTEDIRSLLVKTISAERIVKAKWDEIEQEIAEIMKAKNKALKHINQVKETAKQHAEFLISEGGEKIRGISVRNTISLEYNESLIPHMATTEEGEAIEFYKTKTTLDKNIAKKFAHLLPKGAVSKSKKASVSITEAHLRMADL